MCIDKIMERIEKKHNIINFNFGGIGAAAAGRPQSSSSSNTSQSKQQNDNKQLTSFESLDELRNYIKLKQTTRSYSLHFFQDRYSILFLYPIVPGCSYSSIHYDIIDISNDRGTYAYTTSKITNKNEESCVNYIRLLRCLVGMNGPPNLAIMHRTNSYFMCEIPGNQLACGRYSRKNSRDIVFQLMILLMCIYSTKMYIDNMNISVIMLSEPIILIYKIGSIQFTIEDVFAVPIICPNQTIFKVSTNNISTIEKYNSYQNIGKKIKSLASDDLAIPYIYNEYISECIFAYLLMEFKDESNICSFEPYENDSRMSNKFISRSCLLAQNTYGDVYLDEYTRSILVKVGHDMFYDTNTATIQGANVNDLTRMVSIKEQKISQLARQKSSTQVIRTFSFNCT